jgi:hypothetical protein
MDQRHDEVVRGRPDRILRSGSDGKVRGDPERTPSGDGALYGSSAGHHHGKSSGPLARESAMRRRSPERGFREGGRAPRAYRPGMASSVAGGYPSGAVAGFGEDEGSSEGPSWRPLTKGKAPWIMSGQWAGATSGCCRRCSARNFPQLGQTSTTEIMELIAPWYPPLPWVRVIVDLSFCLPHI